MEKEREVIAQCFWCKQELVDGSDVSGYEGGVDYMTKGEDFGCDAHPVSNDDDVGPHETLEDIRKIVVAHHIGPQGK